MTRTKRRGPQGRATLWVAIAGLLQAGAPAVLAAQVLNFVNYDAAQGIPQAQVLALHQDHLGFIWLGTYGGLTRFDGTSFQTWTRRDGLSATAVAAIAEDRQGRLLVGTIGGGVCIRRAQAFSCLGTQAGLPNQDVADLLPEPGGFWVATDGGLAFVDDRDRVTAYTVRDGLPARQVARVARDRRGRLWVGTAAGLARLDGARFVTDDHPELRGQSIHVLRPTPDGLLVGTGHGLFVLAGDRLTPVPGADRLDELEPVDAARSRDGTLWIATRNGVLRLAAAGPQLLTRSNGLPDNAVNAVVVDRERNVWLGTETGLSKYRPGGFEQFTTREGLPHAFVRAITADRAGRMWVATRDGIAVRENNGFRAVPIRGLPDQRIYALAALPDGGLLIGSRQGLARSDGGVRQVYHRRDGLPDEFVTSLVADPAGGVWIGTAAGLARYDRGRVTTVTDSVLGRAFVTALAYDHRGRLWVGRRSGGLVVRDPDGTSQRLDAADGLSDQPIWAMAADSAGVMWIGTNGDGVLAVNDRGAVRQLTAANGLVNDFVWQVLPDRDGAIWLFTSQGLDRLVGTTFEHFGRADGLIDLEGSAGASWEDPQGDLWFGTGSGVLRYHHAPGPSLAVPPPIYVAGASIGGRPVASGSALSLRSGVLRIQYVSPSFRDPGRLRFRYRLLPTDEAWSELTPERSLSFGGLEPRHYTFEVNAVDADGLTSPTPAAFDFVVRPAFWQTWWFRVLLGLALAGTAALIPWLRQRHLQRDNRRLETLVAQHTVLLATKNVELEREVAERIAAEEAARRQQQRLEEVLSNTTNLFYAHTPDNVLTYVSPQARQFFGLDPDELAGRWTTLLTRHPANQAGVDATQRAIRTGEKQPPYELELVGGGGRPIWVEVNEAPVVKDGRTVAIVGSLTNITEAKRARETEQRLEQQLRQAQKMEAVGRLAGGIAHDFNNLLTVMVGHAEFATGTLDREHPIQADLSEIQRAADRATSLVAQLLAFSRQQLAKRRTIDLNVICAEAVRMLQRVLGSDIEVDLQLAPEAAWVLADHGQLDQILLNLAVNARDAMPGGGRLAIGTELITATDSLAEDVPAGEYVMLRVSDTGQGMDANTRARLFEPFFTTKGVGKGTGLGLAMVYGIVKQNGGHIAVESDAGQGTIFRLHLPRATAPRPMPTLPDARPPRPPTPSSGRVVMVVEDEEGVRQLVCRTLARAGYQVLEARDGDEALALAGRFPDPIDLLLSDMIMPGLNGRQVAAKITAVRAGTRVLFMSGHTDGVLGRNGLADPDTPSVVRKPFTPAELLRRVEDALTGVAV